MNEKNSVHNKKRLIIIMAFVLLFIIGFTIIFILFKNNNLKQSFKYNNNDYDFDVNNEKIKDYVVSAEYESIQGVLIITNENNLYYGQYIEQTNKFEFYKIETDEDVIGVTTEGVDVELSGTGGSDNYNLFVKLKNGETKSIEVDYDKDVPTYTLSEVSVDNIKQQISDILVFDDKTISTVSNFKNNPNNRIKYNNNDLKIDFLFVGNYEGDYSSEPHKLCDYAISDDKLYKLCGDAYSYEPVREYTSVSLYNLKTIKNIDYNHSDSSNSIKSDSETIIYITITYTDNTIDKFSTKKLYFYEYK